jgi:eukaryotic-like serine/threonine-protein kinase
VGLQADEVAAAFVSIRQKHHWLLTGDIIPQQNAMPSPGDTISHYNIVSSIGKGGMGEVYLAEDTRLDRRVALKILLEEVAEDKDRVRRFIQEAKAASALNHPNILTVYEIGEYEHSRYIATEFIEGETLRNRMRNDPMGLNEAIGVALQAAAALAAAHEAGILHRDVKPENIMIRGDGLVKVLDFGLAKLTENPNTSVSAEAATIRQLDTLPGTIVGTVAYMSPEQVRGRKLDARSDIFSLGIVMYELFTGRFPFEGEGHLELASSILKDSPQPIRQLSPALPRQLERIVDKALRKDRDNRYQHVKDMQIDLEDLRDELKFEAKKTMTADQPLPANTTQWLTLSESISTQRRFTLLHAFVFVAIAAVLVGAAWYLRSGVSTLGRVPGSYKTTEVASWSSAPGEVYSSAKFSPDGKMIAFASTKSGTKNIWITQAGSTDAIQITNDGFSNIDPVWSPRGDEIAYYSRTRGIAAENTGGPGIWRVPALGGTPRLIAPFPSGQPRLRRWTRSGKIYYEMYQELHVVDVSNGASQQVTTLGEAGIRWIDISADERSIIVATQTENAWRIVIKNNISGDGLAEEVVRGEGRIDDGFAWLPEKDRLYYSATVDGVQQVFVTRIGSGGGVRITAGETDTSVVDASPDGRSIVINSAKEESNLWRVGVADGRESPVSRDINAKIWPDVSPGNDRVAFQSVKDLSQGNKLYETAVVVKNLRSADDSERPTQLAEPGYLAAWSPDGAAIAFLRPTNSEHDLHLINPTGGGERRVTTGIAALSVSVSPYNYSEAKAFSWSPDASGIAYISKKSGASNIWIVRPGDGSDSMLTDNSDANTSLSCPLWSSDGKRLAFSYQKRLGDGTTQQGLEVSLTDPPQRSRPLETAKLIRLVGWTPEETALIFAERETRAAVSPEVLIKRVPIAGGPETVIANLKNTYFYNIFLSDDRKFIAYAARNENKDDLFLVPSAGGTPRKLTVNNDTAQYYSRLAWLHDGSAIVFGKQSRFSLLSMITGID